MRGRSIDATAAPPPDVEEAARSLAESRAVPRDDATAARDEAGVIILQTLGDAMRGFPHVGNRIFEQLADLTDKQRLLLFWISDSGRFPSFHWAMRILISSPAVRSSPRRGSQPPT